MDELYSVRHGITKLELQIDTINSATRRALYSVINDSISSNSYSRLFDSVLAAIYKDVCKYYIHDINSNFKSFISDVVYNSELHEVIDFIEVIFLVINKGEIFATSIIDDFNKKYLLELNKIFLIHKFQYKILADGKMIPVFEKELQNELDIIINDNQKYREYILEAIKEYNQNPGKSILASVKGLEQYLMDSFGLNSNTLPNLFKQAISKISSTNQIFQNIINENTKNIDYLNAVRNNAKNAGHAGQFDYTASEAKFCFMVVSSIIIYFKENEI